MLVYNDLRFSGAVLRRRMGRVATIETPITKVLVGSRSFDAEV